MEVKEKGNEGKEGRKGEGWMGSRKREKDGFKEMEKS